MKKRIILVLLISSLFVSTILLESDFSDEVYGQTSATDWWPMFQHDPNHSGYSTSSAPNTPETRFIVNYTTCHSSYSSPIVYDGMLIVGWRKYCGL
jgi:hypothetical protein